MDAVAIRSQELKVLYCEDSEISGNSLRNFLTHRFCKVYYAADGEEGWQLYNKYQPDLIITDIRMPRLDGLKMARRIREKDDRTKIIIVSAHNDINYFMEAIDYGISAFIKKPIDLKLLDRQIKEMLEDLKLHKRIREEEQRRIKIQSDNNKLFQEIRQDLALARSVQEYLLPDWLLLHEKLVFTTAYVPSLIVGGDLFGYFPITKKRFVFYLGDVSGHGLKSAMLMMAANSTINMLVEQEKKRINIARLVNRLNKILSINLLRDRNYMTFIMGTIDTDSGEVRYIRAGHPEIIVFDHSTSKAKLMMSEKGTIPIGWLDNFNYSDDDVDCFTINKNQTCFVYSDGLFECTRENGEQLGQDGLLKLLEEKIPETNSLTSSLEVMEHLKDEGYDISQDDFTLVSFFQPTSATIPQLKNSYQAIIPENIDLEEIECREFLLQNTGNAQFASTFEENMNALFQLEDFRNESYFISSFLLLLVFNDNRIECRFWIKKEQDETNEYAVSKLDEEEITATFRNSELYSQNYLQKLHFKNLGDFLEVNCVFKT